MLAVCETDRRVLMSERPMTENRRLLHCAALGVALGVLVLSYSWLTLPTHQRPPHAAAEAFHEGWQP